jgi:septal ring factor EnvC (AmiA/AmiB activator)
MSVWRKCNVIAPVSLSLALLVTGCETKVSQCQRLIQVVNEGNALIDQNKGKQAVTSLQLSKDLEAINTALEELKLGDPKLQEFQSQFQKVFESMSQGIAKAAKALAAAKAAEASASGREKIQKARTEIDTALTAVAKTSAKESDALMNKLNKYCSEPQ